MSKTTQDPTKYFRAGIAIKIEDKAALDVRLAALGLATAGELVALVAKGPLSMIEAMKPGAAEYLQARSLKKATTVRSRVALAKQLKDMDPETLARLMELAKKEAA